MGRTGGTTGATMFCAEDDGSGISRLETETVLQAGHGRVQHP